MTLSNRMLSLFSYISSIPDINSGGCLFASLAVYTVLKNEGYNCEDLVIVQLSKEGYDVSWNRGFIDEKFSSAIPSDHFVLSPDGGKTLQDIGGKISISDLREDYQTLIIPNHKIESFCETALINGNWNRSFKRTSGVKEINFCLGINLPNYRRNYRIKTCKSKN